MLALWCLIAQEQEKISIHHYLHVILTSPSWGLSVEKTKYHKVFPQKTMGQKCSLRCFIGRYFPSVGWVSIVFRILHNHFTQPKGYVAQIWPSPENMPGWSLVGDRLVSFDAVVWAISTPAFFSLEVHDYLPGKQNYELLFLPPPRLLPLSDMSRAGKEACRRCTAVAGCFAFWPTAEKLLSLESPFFPSQPVSSLTHNYFSLPIPSYSQLPLKSLLHITFL